MTSNTINSYTYNTGTYDIICNFNEPYLYIKLVNNITYNCYEINNIDITQYKIPYTANEIYDIIIKSIQCDDPNYYVIYAINHKDKLLYLVFYILHKGLYMKFDIQVPEKVNLICNKCNNAVNNI